MPLPHIATSGADSYIVGRELGRGTFGVTRLLVHRTTGVRFAGKFIPVTQITEDVEREILNHRLLDHENVTRFHEVYIKDEHLVVVVELASQGELFNILSSGGPVAEHDARHLFRQLIAAVSYCHGVHVVHRDLKLENVLLHLRPDGQLQVKLADFGFSKHSINHSAPHSFKGSIDYMAPEVIAAGLRGGHWKYDGKAADTWSCGVILYLLVTGLYPFDTSSNNRLGAVMKKITAGAYQMPPGVAVSAECRDLIRRILCPRPQNRITMSQIKQHPWLADVRQDDTSSLPHHSPARPPLQDERAVRRIINQACKGPDMPTMDLV